MAGQATQADAIGMADPAVAKIISKIKKGNDEERGEAWQLAWRYGEAAVGPLAVLMADGDFRVARAAKRALWGVVRHAGRPGAELERRKVVERLLPLLAEGQPDNVRREVMWMLSEIAGDEAVEPVSALLGNERLREDARMVLERLPGEKSLAALKAALRSAPQDFKINIVQSLRARGLKIAGYPCRKLVPTRKTTLKPIQ